MLQTRGYLERKPRFAMSGNQHEAREYQRCLKLFSIHQLASRLIALFQNTIAYVQALRERFTGDEFGRELFSQCGRRFKGLLCLVEETVDFRLRMMTG